MITCWGWWCQNTKSLCFLQWNSVYTEQQKHCLPCRIALHLTWWFWAVLSSIGRCNSMYDGKYTCYMLRSKASMKFAHAISSHDIFDFSINFSPCVFRNPFLVAIFHNPHIWVHSPIPPIPNPEFKELCSRGRDNLSGLLKWTLFFAIERQGHKLLTTNMHQVGWF